MDRAIARTRPLDMTSYVGAFMRRVYNWMGVGLLITAAVAYLTAQSPSLVRTFVANPIIPIILFIAEIGIAIALGGFIQKMRVQTAMALFVVFAGLMGLSLSGIFIAYQLGTIFNAFFSTAAMFGAMSIYGYVTKRDLTKMGAFLFMGLIGLFIAMIINMLFKSPMMNYVISIIGVIIFVGLTAYDTQKIKTMALEGFGEADVESKAAVVGALSLYLDFINIFVFMLQLFGGSRD